MQTKRMSLVESCANVAVGWSINTVANLLVLPLFGFNVTLRDALGIGAVFTVIAIVRNYLVRRAFNHRWRA